jgi:hypothetical protein
LLFEGETLDRIRNHPMAAWRIKSTPQKEPILSQLDEAEREVEARNAAYTPKSKGKNEQEI